MPAKIGKSYYNDNKIPRKIHSNNTDIITKAPHKNKAKIDYFRKKENRINSNNISFKEEKSYSNMVFLHYQKIANSPEASIKEITNAKYHLACFYETGIYVQKNIDKAVDLYYEVALTNHYDAITDLLSIASEKDKDYHLVLGKANYFLGNLYVQLKPVNLEQAAHHYRKALFKHRYKETIPAFLHLLQHQITS